MNEQPEFNSGSTKLANTLKRMMKSTSAPPLVLDFGIVNSDYSLSLNRFPLPVPKDEYSVCRSLLYDLSVPLTETYVDGSHDHYGSVPAETHYHEVRLPLKMRWLKPGDKVLVAVIQNEFVIIDIVFSGSWLGVSEPPWT